MSARLLSAKEECLVVQAIREAESDTSGEIRVHIEPLCGDNPLERAVEVFFKLGMNDTAARNGVLIYVASRSRKVAIIGDKGIDELVPEGFWDRAYAILADHFSKGRFAQGLCEAIRSIGSSLKEYFPHSDNDVNEQSDEISFG